MLQFNDTAEEKKLDELHAVEAEELAQVLAQKYGLPYIDLSKFAINTDALRLIPEPEAREANVAAFKLTGKHLFIVAVAPESEKAKAIFEDLRNKNYTLELYLGSVASLERAWGRYVEISKSTRTHAGVIDIADEDIARIMEAVKTAGDVAEQVKKEEISSREEGGISGVLEVILAGGIVTEASDIHIEPQEEKVRLRYRLDGVLQDISLFDHHLYKQLLSRVKLVSGLKLNVQKSAQDGRFSIHVRETEIEIRTSVLPGAYGESIVLRLLNPETIAATFETLGVEPHLFQIMAAEIAKPDGMVLLTGPTGSGKTTTLYAFLRQISTSENKIITIEDPIEYHLKGINQTQVDSAKHYTFLSGLRSALRQDPDVIMVGEIRDAETARTAVHAALTGHLVLSTLHTNNAAGAIPRLIDLGVNPKILDASLTLSIAQRLVRKLCPTCRVETAPSPEEKKMLEDIRESILRRRQDLDVPSVGNIWRAKEGGCAECHHTGYRGREGVFEAIKMDPSVAKILAANLNERDVKIAALPQGILDMRQDGVIKVIKGVTTLEELSRVVDLTEEILG
jgi:type II secretory ATPase GspE/PulE/Tfp pilus assembly ATPase PilB-like protein